MKRATLSGLGENGLIHLLTRNWKTREASDLGVGDDCAVVTLGRERVVLKTDAMVVGRHFLPTTRPGWIGRKALARVLSDFAAMGATPRAALITLGLPTSQSVKALQQIYRGLEGLARQHEVDLVGGETVQSETLWLSVSAIGTMEGRRPVLRSGARAGDDLWVTGRLGGSRGRREFLFEPRLKEGSWLAQHKLATAMMDLSDGLAMDLPRLAARSGISFQLEEESLPRHKHCTVQQALGDGEDFELLFTSRRRDRERLKKLWPFPCRLSRIGVILPASEKSTIFHHAHGFDHFKLG